MALSYLYLVDVLPHQQMGMGVVEGISMKYHGNHHLAPGGGTRLEAALNTIMADRIEPADRTVVVSWIRNGARQSDFETVKPIFEKSCIVCHSPASGLPVPPLTDFEAVQKLTQVDAGPSITQLARVSHVHLFGIGIFFLLTGAIFSLSETPLWLRVPLVVLPYFAILADIGGWWLTKFVDAFDIVVVVSGAIMGLTLACQILISLWDMWIPMLRGHSSAGAQR